MTDNEIVKALECCMGCCCKECPNFNENDIDAECCMSRLIVETLKLINRQKAYIEKLKPVHNSFERELECAKQEAIKEFAERLSEKAPHITEERFPVLRFEIERLVKKMTEEAK